MRKLAAATNYTRTTDDLCIVHWSRPPVSQHSALSHYRSETEILNICTFCKKIVCQQRYLTSVLFVNRHNRSLYCPITNTTWPSIFDATYQFESHTKLQNCKKRHLWYVYVTHTCLDVATKPEKLQKKELMIYVALATKPEKLQKIFMLLYTYPCYPCTFRYCTNGRGSVPSLISKEHHLDAPRQQEPLVLFAKKLFVNKTN